MIFVTNLDSQLRKALKTNECIKFKGWNVLMPKFRDYVLSNDLGLFIKDDNIGMSFAYAHVDSFDYDSKDQKFIINGVYDNKIKIGKKLILEFNGLSVSLNTEKDAETLVKYHKELLKRMKLKEIKDTASNWEG